MLPRWSFVYFQRIKKESPKLRFKFQSLFINWWSSKDLQSSGKIVSTFDPFFVVEIKQGKRHNTAFWIDIFPFASMRQVKWRISLSRCVWSWNVSQKQPPAAQKQKKNPTLVNWQELTLQANNSVNEWTARQALMIMMMLRKIKNAKTTEANLS